MTDWVVRSNVLVELYSNRDKLLVTSDEEQTEWNTQLTQHTHHKPLFTSQLMSQQIITARIIKFK